MRGSGTRPCSPSSTSTFSARTGRARACCEAAVGPRPRPCRAGAGSAADALDVRVGVDRGAATGVHLEVQVRSGVAGVAGVAQVGDVLAGADASPMRDRVGGQVGVVVLVAVVAVQ